MSRAVIGKTLRDSAWLLLLLTAAVLVFETLFVRSMREFSSEISAIWMQKPIIRRMLAMLVGADLAVDLTPTTLMAMGFAHPLVYALNWIWLLTTCTRVIAGEIDRGTADLLLALPISRARVYASVTLVWALGCVPLSLATISGIALGERYSPLWEPIVLDRLLMIVPNLLLLNLAIGAATLLASAWLSRRGPAVATMLAVLLASMLISFLGLFWETAARLGFLGLLDYYKPLPMIRTGRWPMRDLIVLSVLGAGMWTAGMIRFSRRDIPAT